MPYYSLKPLNSQLNTPENNEYKCQDSFDGIRLVVDMLQLI
jgi:hypothetical protein